LLKELDNHNIIIFNYINILYYINFHDFKFKKKEVYKRRIINYTNLFKFIFKTIKSIFKIFHNEKDIHWLIKPSKVIKYSLNSDLLQKYLDNFNN